MTKSEILAELTRTGEVSRFSRTQTWEKAFNLYNENNPRDKKSPNCGHCFRTVLGWLQN